MYSKTNPGAGYQRVSPGVYEKIGSPAQAANQGVQQLQSFRPAPMPRFNKNGLPPPQQIPMPRVNQMPPPGVETFQATPPRKATGWNDNFGFGDPNGGAMRPQYNNNGITGYNENFGFGGPNGGAMRPGQYGIGGPGKGAIPSSEEESFGPSPVGTQGQPGGQFNPQPPRPQYTPSAPTPRPTRPPIGIAPAVPGRPRGPEGRPNMAQAAMTQMARRR